MLTCRTTRNWALVAMAVLALLSPRHAEAQAALPAGIQDAIRSTYGEDAHYLSGTVDLNADGRPEVIVHVVGPSACGTGGCPTLVFTTNGTGYRLVTAISVSRPPIRVAAVSTKGWRNLVVQTRGGGSVSRDVELAFNGSGYPTNPTVLGPRVKATAMPGGDVVIPAFKEFSETHALGPPARRSPPSGSGRTPSTPAGRGPNAPSFDCGRALTAVERLICDDPTLAMLDRAVAAGFGKALTRQGAAGMGAERTRQRSWITTRDACGRAAQTRACLTTSYQKRAVALQISNGELMVPKAVEFTCDRRQKEPFTVVFYSDTEPRAAVITMGSHQSVAFIERAASGSRYASDAVDYWEHQGEAKVTWAGQPSITCRPVR